MAVFLANIGANSSHAARGLESALNPDGTFALMPIPEAGPWLPPMLRLGDLGHLAHHCPPRWRESPVHHDPDLTSAIRTYGDNCSTAGRAYSLRHAQPGDLIVFMARLRTAPGGACFALIGNLEVGDALAEVTADPGPGWWDGNAHVRRARATGTWNRFWVFRGTDRSRLLDSAIPFGRAAADHLFASTWRWRPDRTQLQTIGSNTRAVRRLTGQSEAELRRLMA